MTERSVLVAGGTVQAGAGLYLERTADVRLLELCRAGEFAFVLTSRQMGKSSLLIRTAERLLEEGFRPVFVDLTELGKLVDAERWYRELVIVIANQLELPVDVRRWWADASDRSLAQRFTSFLRDVALPQAGGKVILFIDEIDTTLSLDFTDDFFIAIRYLYNARANDPLLNSLSFVLSGVATPGDLIKDAARTPFNIGTRVELTDFTLKEALPLLAVLPVPPDTARTVMQAILSHTGGHPYLTLKVARSLVLEPPARWSEDAVAERVAALFYGQTSESDFNLALVRDMLTKNARQPENTLRLYCDVRRGRAVPDQELDEIRNWLKLSGVVVPRGGQLRVRNPIYERVFDVPWANRHIALYVNWRRRLTRAAAALVAVLMVLAIPLAIWAWLERQAAIAQRLAAEQARDAAVVARMETAQQAKELDAQRHLAEEASKQALMEAHRAQEAAAVAQLEREAARKARQGAVTSLSRTHFVQGESLIGQGRAAAGLGYLLAAARADPSNAAARDLAFDTLVQAGFAVPLGRVSVVHADPSQSELRTPLRLSLSADGTRLLGCERLACELFTLGSNQNPDRFSPLDAMTTVGAALTSDNRWVAVIGDSGVATPATPITIADAAGRPERRIVRLPSRLDPGTLMLAVGRSRILLKDAVSLSVVNAAAGRVEFSTRDIPGDGAIALSDNGPYFAFARTDYNRLRPAERVTPNVTVYDATTGAALETLPTEQRLVSVLGLSTDGSELAIGYQNGTIELATIAPSGVVGQRVSNIRTMTHGAGIVALRFSADGRRLASAGSDGTVIIWSVDQGRSYFAPIRSSAPSVALAFAADNVIVTSSAAREVDRWRLMPPPFDFHHAAGDVVVAFGQGGDNPARVLIGTSPGAVGVWDLTLGRMVAGPFADPDGKSADYAEISRDGRRIAVGSDSDPELRVWDVASGRLLCRDSVGADGTARISADGRWAMTWMNATLTVVDVESRCAMKRSLQAKGRIDFAAFSEDGQRLVVTASDTACLYGRESREMIACVPHSAELPITDFSMSPRRYVTVNESTVQVYDLSTGKPVGPPFKSEGDVQVAVIDRAGERVLTGAGTEAQLWAVGSGRPIGQVMRHEQSVEIAAFSPDGLRVVTLGEDDRVRVWDAATGQPVTGWFTDGNDYDVAYFSADGSRVIMADDDWVYVRDVFRSEPSDIAALETLVRQRGGTTLDADGVPRSNDLSAAAKESTASIRASAALEPMVRWLLSDPGRRSISPRTRLTTAELLQLLDKEEFGDYVRELAGMPPSLQGN